MTTTILIICSANICRSPLAAFCAQRLLGNEIVVRSAGVDARQGSPMCKEAAKLIWHLPGAEEFTEGHSSQGVTPDLLQEAGLVLCATSEQKDEVGRLDHTVRSRAFTLLEAAQIVEVLGENLASRRLPATPEGRSPVAADPVLDYAAMLHESRWRVASLPDLEAVGWLRRRQPREDQTFSLGDWHQGLARSHVRVLMQTRRSAEAVVAPFATSPS